MEEKEEQEEEEKDEEEERQKHSKKRSEEREEKRGEGEGGGGGDQAPSSTGPAALGSAALLLSRQRRGTHGGAACLKEVTVESKLRKLVKTDAQAAVLFQVRNGERCNLLPIPPTHPPPSPFPPPSLAGAPLGPRRGQPQTESATRGSSRWPKRCARGTRRRGHCRTAGRSSLSPTRSAPLAVGETVILLTTPLHVY